MKSSYANVIFLFVSYFNMLILYFFLLAILIC